MSKEICSILEKEADIPGDCIYITYHGIDNWGWNGMNFWRLSRNWSVGVRNRMDPYCCFETVDWILKFLEI